MRGELLTLLAVIYILCLANGSQYKRVCYYTNWSQYRAQESIKFFPANINASLCTHIIYAFANISDGEIKPYEWNDVLTKPGIGMYTRVNNLKTTNPDLKVLLAVGGWKMGTAPFIAVSSTKEKRQKFITSAARFLRQHGFDGLDYDWEFPDPNSKSLFTDLLKDTKEYFQSEASSTGFEKLILSAAVASGKWLVEQGYQVAEVSKNLDFINLMAYDLHELGGTQGVRLLPNAALYSGSSDDAVTATHNVDYAVKMWIKMGVERSKLVLGLGAYGRTFKTIDGDTVTPGSRAFSYAPAGRYINEPKMYPYYEICENVKQPAWVEEWDDERKVPYAFNRGERLWVGYDNPRSIKEKVDYAVNNSLAGVMIWPLDMDDFNNKCGAGVYPLLTAAKDRLAVYEKDATTATTTTIGQDSTTRDRCSIVRCISSADKSALLLKGLPFLCFLLWSLFLWRALY